MRSRACPPAGALVRAGLADRLMAAGPAAAPRLRLRVVEGHRPVERAARDHRAVLRRGCAPTTPGIDAARAAPADRRFVAPVDVAPHVAGAAVDLTLVDVCGEELDMGTPIDATPEDSDGAATSPPTGIGADARAHRELLAAVLSAHGLVNYPTEWWHWSYGDRYWALVTGAPAALYGPVARARCAA